MRTTGKVAGVGLVLLGLAGCGAVNPTVATPNQEYVGLNGYYAAIKAGDTYMRLPLCGGAVVVCRTQALSQSVYSALAAIRSARKAITAAVEQGQPQPLTALQALEDGYSIIKQIPTQ